MISKKYSRLPIVWTFVLLLFAFLVGFTFFRNRLPGDLRYVERITSVRFPKEISQIEIAHPREFCLSGKMQLPSNAAEKFVQEAGFSLGTNYPLNSESGIEPKLFDTPVMQGVWFKLASRTQNNRWEFAYNPTNRFLWFVLLFPDYSGDPP